MLMWHDRSGPQPVASFNDLVPSAGSLQGRCQGWTPLARGLFVEGESRLQLRHTASPRWIFITVVRRLRWGWETGGGWIKMLRRWFFKDTSKALPSTAVSKWRWAVGDGEGVGCISGTGGGTHGGSGLQGGPAPLDSSVTRLSGP